VSAKVRQYVPACLMRISPPHWVRARNAKSIRQAYRIVKEVEHHLPFPWPEPIEAMGEQARRNRQSPVEFMGQSTSGEKFSPPSTVRKHRGGQPRIKQHRVEPKDIKVVRVTLPPKARVEPMDGAEWERGWNHSPGGGRWRYLDKCYIGDVMEDGTYQYGPHNQPGDVVGPASEATTETSAEFHARNEQDFEKWEEVCDA